MNFSLSELPEFDWLTPSEIDEAANVLAATHDDPDSPLPYEDEDQDEAMTPLERERFVLDYQPDFIPSPLGYWEMVESGYYYPLP